MLFTKFLSEQITYTGEELQAQWCSGKTGHYGDTVVGFLGPCKVPTAHLVDLVDRRSAAFIEAKQMLHFLGEWFDGDLRLAVTRQRLLIASCAELLRQKVKHSGEFERVGNDVFFLDGKKRKLSVSIVTASPVSTLFHFAVNVDATGAPVAAVGLQELGLDPVAFGNEVLARWQTEWTSMETARCKVAPR